MKTIARTMLVLVAAVLTIFLVGCDRHQKDDGGWPQKPSHRVVLKPFEAGETIRYATYWPDGMTVKEYQIEYRDGLTTFQEFRQDGSLAAMKEVYPGDGNRQTKSERFFSADGKKVVLRSEWRNDRTLSIKGQRLSNGMAEQLFFDSSGQVAVRYQVLSGEGKEIHSQTIVGGALPVSQPVSDGLLITTKRPNGLNESIEVVRPDGFEDIDFFDLDGVTLKMTVRVGYDIGAAYYNDDGTEVTTWRKFTDDGGMEVTVYRPCTDAEQATWPAPSGSILDSLPSTPITNSCKAVAYVQTWSVDSTTKDDGSPIPYGERTYKLTSVEVKGADGKTAKKYVFDGEGRLSEVDLYKDGSETQAKFYREDGTLERINDLNSWGGIDKQEYVDATKNIRDEHADPRMKRPISFVDPRAFVKAPVEPPPPPPFTWGDEF